MRPNQFLEWEDLHSRGGGAEPVGRCDHRLPDEGDAVPLGRGLLLPSGLEAVHKGR